VKLNVLPLSRVLSTRGGIEIDNDAVLVHDEKPKGRFCMTTSYILCFSMLFLISTVPEETG
jgi:hypothetical protein